MNASAPFTAWLLRLLCAGLLFQAGSFPDVCAAEPMSLTQMKDADFSKWIMGTEWEYPTAGGKRRIWFATPGVVIYSRMEEKGDKSASGFSWGVTKRGAARFYYEAGDKRPFDVTIADDLKKATFYDVKNNERYQASFVSRRVLPPPPKMTDAEFTAWLKGKTLTAEDSNIHFPGDGTVRIKSSRNNKTFKFTVIRPGLLYFLWDENPRDPTLISLDTGLASARIWAWWGTKEHSVRTGASPASAVAAQTVPASAKSSVVTMNDLKAITLTTRASAVNALLVQELGNSRFAGKASSLSLSALPLEGDKPATIAFNQSVGSMMQKALQEVARFQAIRHGGWPRAHQMQLSFEDKFGGKDGPSAAVACALLLESVIKGTALDLEFAVTGDLNADGSVQPIGGVHAKLRGATNLKCKLLGIPSKNVIHATDLVLTEGLKPFTGIQVFSLATFDDALAVARVDKSPELTAAIKDFALLSRSVAATPAALRAPDAIAKLKGILQRAPGHLSAQILLLYATDKLPKSLSPAGTLSELDQSVGDLNTAISGDLTATNKLDGGQIARARTALQRLRPLADARVRPLVDAWVNWGNIADKLAHATGPVNEQSVKEWGTAISRIGVEDEKLRSNESFREELK